MLLNKKDCTCTCNCSTTGECSCNGEECTCGKQTNESVENNKELLGSFNKKIPVVETNNNEYKVIKEAKRENILFS